ncbi:MAG: DMT family transporter [Microvirgula sp.]
MRSLKILPILCTLTTALVWGLLWYPFRFLTEQGISASMTSMLVYLLCATVGIALFWRDFKRYFRPEFRLLVLMVIFGWTNLGYTWAVTEGQVMRVMLLFYLSPLWTAFLSWLILKETLTRAGLAVIGLSLLGCAITLYRPGLWSGSAMLSERYEWFALTAGFAYSLGTVLSRRAQSLALPVKSACIWLGVAGFAAVTLTLSGRMGEIRLLTPVISVEIVLIAACLLATSIVSQHGVSLLPANQVMTLMLTELVFAAVSAYLLASERMSLQEWIGGGLIIAASLLSGKMHAGPEKVRLKPEPPLPTR